MQYTIGLKSQMRAQGLESNKKLEKNSYLLGEINSFALLSRNFAFLLSFLLFKQFFFFSSFVLLNFLRGLDETVILHRNSSDHNECSCCVHLDNQEMELPHCIWLHWFIREPPRVGTLLTLKAEILDEVWRDFRVIHAKEGKEEDGKLESRDNHVADGVRPDLHWHKMPVLHLVEFL